MKYRTILAMLLTLALGAADGLAARQLGHAMGGMVGMGPMGGMDLASPIVLLHHSEMLDLSDSQIRRLEALAASEYEAHRMYRPEMLRAHADLLEAMGGGGRPLDEARARAALGRQGQLTTELALFHLRMREEAWQVLTRDQQTYLEAMALSGGMGMCPMMHAMGGGMGMCPMMQGMGGGMGMGAMHGPAAGRMGAGHRPGPNPDQAAGPCPCHRGDAARCPAAAACPGPRGGPCPCPVAGGPHGPHGQHHPRILGRPHHGGGPHHGR